MKPDPKAPAGGASSLPTRHGGNTPSLVTVFAQPLTIDEAHQVWLDRSAEIARIVAAARPLTASERKEADLRRIMTEDGKSPKG